jgi:hypothetical protein
MSEKRHFEVENKKYYVSQPTPKILQEANVLYSVELSKCLKRGVHSKQQMIKFLTDNGVWSDDKEKKEKKILDEISAVQNELYHGSNGVKRMSLKEGRRLAIKMKDLRRDLMSLISERQSHESNTAESLADNARFDFLVASCTFNEDGTKVFSSYENYVENAQNDVSYKAASALAGLMYDLDEDYTKKLPENVFLSRYNLVDEKLRFIDKQGNLVDREYRKINEEGHYLDKDGNRVDRDGKPLDKDGNYIIEVEFYDDEDEVEQASVVETEETKEETKEEVKEEETAVKTEEKVEEESNPL